MSYSYLYEVLMCQRKCVSFLNCPIFKIFSYEYVYLLVLFISCMSRKWYMGKLFYGIHRIHCFYVYKKVCHLKKGQEYEYCVCISNQNSLDVAVINLLKTYYIWWQRLVRLTSYNIAILYHILPKGSSIKGWTEAQMVHK